MHARKIIGTRNKKMAENEYSTPVVELTAPAAAISHQPSAPLKCANVKDTGMK